MTTQSTRGHNQALTLGVTSTSNSELEWFPKVKLPASTPGTGEYHGCGVNALVAPRTHLSKADRGSGFGGDCVALWYISADGLLPQGSLNHEVRMKIDYHETTKDLLTRIDIHEKYGARNIDQWTIDVLQPRSGTTILDVGCGAGKQCFLYSDYTKRMADITGGDFSAELLDLARARNKERGDKIAFQVLDFNQPFEFPDNAFDLVSSAFAIYYASDLRFTFGEAHRVLKPGGRLFVTGPLPENKQMFYDVIREATSKPIPPMPGSSRFKGEIYNTIQGLFSMTDLLTFENPITFPAVEPFMDYVRSSLSEDRKLWKSMFDNTEQLADLLRSIQDVAQRWFARGGKLVMIKVVGGILATK